ncbi:MAG: hypothetical protein MJ157_03840 [Clostridia bacterium]|nr:hypothetical protein [Clostridia bacterium]
MSIRTAQELTSYLQSKLDTDKMLINLIVQREISNFKQLSSEMEHDEGGIKHNFIDFYKVFATDETILKNTTDISPRNKVKITLQ